MRIDLDDAKRGPVPWSETLDLWTSGSGTSDLSEAGVAELGPIAHQGELAYAEPNYRLRGSLHYEQRLSCYRCLVDFEDEVGDDFEYLLERAPFRKAVQGSADSGGLSSSEASSTAKNGVDSVELSDSAAPVSGGAEIELSQDDLELIAVESDHIDTTVYIREQILLHVPMKPLCSPTCKGLCSQCGIDLNQDSCTCTTTPSDPRWAGLAALKDQLES